MYIPEQFHWELGIQRFKQVIGLCRQNGCGQSNHTQKKPSDRKHKQDIVVAGPAKNTTIVPSALT